MFAVLESASLVTACNIASSKRSGTTVLNMTESTTRLISANLVFRVLSRLRRERMVDNDQNFTEERFGRISTGNYWGINDSR